MNTGLFDGFGRLLNSTLSAARLAGLDYLYKAYGKPTLPGHLPWIPNSQPSELHASVTRGSWIVDSMYDITGPYFSSYIDHGTNLFKAAAAVIPTSNAYTTFLDIPAGSGMLNFLAIDSCLLPTGSLIDNTDVRLTIDGNIIIDTAINTSMRSSARNASILVGRHSWEVVPNISGTQGFRLAWEPQPIPFNESIKIEIARYTVVNAGIAKGVSFHYTRSS